jgi:hypothetical protein
MVPYHRRIANAGDLVFKDVYCLNIEQLLKKC